MTSDKPPYTPPKPDDKLVSHGASADKQWAKVFSSPDRPPAGGTQPVAPTPPPSPVYTPPQPAARAPAPTPPPRPAYTPPQTTASTPAPRPAYTVQQPAAAQPAPPRPAYTPPQPAARAPEPTPSPRPAYTLPPSAATTPTPPPRKAVVPPPVGGLSGAAAGGRPPVPPPPVGGLQATGTTANRPTLTDRQFQTYADLIYDLSGMRFEKSKSYFIATKLEVRCKALGIANFDDYYQYIQSPSGRAEYGPMIDEMTINETFFFRHQPQLVAFMNEVLQPMLFARKQQHATKLRIWSCAASTGDEAYTTALMIKDMRLNNDIIIEIVGTDICHDALDKARAGRYKKYSIRNIPEHMMQQYFTYDEATRDYILSDEIKKMVRFQESNLMDPQRIGSLGKFDIAFCRNVLIYFDDASKTQVVQNIVNAMHDDGVVLMGHSENIHGQRHLLQVDRTRTASLSYVKV